MFQFLKNHANKLLTSLLLILVIFLLFLSHQLSKIENHIILPPYTFIDINELGFVSVSGSLVSTTDEKIASPINTVEFICDQKLNTCELRQAELFDGDYLTFSKEQFQITKWDENYITFESLPENQKCVIWKYRIDRFNEKLEARRERSTTYDEDTCLGIGLVDFGLTVKDGLEAIREIKQRD